MCVRCVRGRNTLLSKKNLFPSSPGAKPRATTAPEGARRPVVGAGSVDRAGQGRGDERVFLSSPRLARRQEPRSALRGSGLRSGDAAARPRRWRTPSAERSLLLGSDPRRPPPCSQGARRRKPFPVGRRARAPGRPLRNMALTPGCPRGFQAASSVPESRAEKG